MLKRPRSCGPGLRIWRTQLVKKRGRLVDLRYVGFDGYKVSKTARRRELLELLERISCAYFY